MTAIRVDSLWKQYRYGQLGYGTLRHDLQSWWAGRRGRSDPNAKLHSGRSRREGAGSEGRFWALTDVSFDVERGDVVGIVGANGAGKSTLLKIMSRVTCPTNGTIRLRGRLASLLEVGTGFHPELTGRENVFLNGVILGMTRSEVQRKFDEIVCFSGLERFIDTPVKRFSSGMYVRLAFSVAAHLEPEILVVDEVLAVGDAEFQKRCLGKLQTVARDGRTVIFVSHNVASVAALCRKGLWLDAGRLRLSGPVEEVLDRYLASLESNAESPLASRVDRNGTGSNALTDVVIRASESRSAGTVSTGGPCSIQLSWRGEGPVFAPLFRLSFYARSGAPVLHLDSRAAGLDVRELPASGSVICEIPRLPLTEGHYRVNVSLSSGSETLDHVSGARLVTVNAGDFFGTGVTASGLHDVCVVDQRWKVT